MTGTTFGYVADGGDEAAPVVARTDEGCLRIRLRELRGDRSLTEVANLVGIRGDELGRIERGDTSQIRFATLLRLCTALGVSLDTLFEVQDADGQAPRYTAAMDAFLAGDLPSSPRARRQRRSADLDEQDMAEVSEYAEVVADPRPTRRGTGTMNP
jgi:transcriptional regulator with XRE-family HTH domain